ncbi:MAG TPA: pyridoxal-dependent decarboxylase, partial [Methylomirabilota bacterium]|nr:pyridoxal-dependent decarboxylase [Methylomirabilota bacterium]
PKVEGALDSFNLSVQWSRRMNSLKLWVTLRVHGRRAYEDLIHRHFELSRSFAEWVRASEDFELVTPPQLPSVIFRVRLPSGAADEVRAANEAVVHEVTRDGRRWISTAIVGGRPVIRMLAISYLSEGWHLEELKSALVAARRTLRRETARVTAA